MAIRQYHLYFTGLIIVSDKLRSQLLSQTIDIDSSWN